MRYEMTGGTAYPLVKLLLLDNGETVKIERGSMAYKKIESLALDIAKFIPNNSN